MGSVLGISYVFVLSGVWMEGRNLSGVSERYSALNHEIMLPLLYLKSQPGWKLQRSTRF